MGKYTKCKKHNEDKSEQERSLLRFVAAQVVNQSDDDWMKFIKSDSDGLTKTGQLLLQKAAEAYVYCILRAQAQTHWQIVGAGAKSLQAQQILEKLVKATYK